MILPQVTTRKSARSDDKGNGQRLLGLIEQVAQASPEIMAMSVEAQASGIKRVTCPEAFDAAARLKVCVLLKLGYSRAMAALQLGFHRSTVGKVMQRDPVFKQQVLRAEELYEWQPLLTVIEAAQNDWRAAVWLMKNFGRMLRWHGERRRSRSGRATDLWKISSGLRFRRWDREGNRDAKVRRLRGRRRKRRGRERNPRARKTRSVGIRRVVLVFRTGQDQPSNARNLHINRKRLISICITNLVKIGG